MHLPAVHRAPLRRLAVAAALACSLAAQAQAPTQAYDLPAQPLGSTLARIAAREGRQISIDAELVRGLQAPAVRGELTAEQAARAALAGSGLELVRTDSGNWGLRRATSTATPAAAAVPAAGGALAAVTVTAQAERSATTEGSGAYTAQAATVGGRMGEALREVPRSISVMTRQQLDDQHVTQLYDAMTQLPGVTASYMNGNGPGVAYYTRGYQISSFTADGIAATAGSSTAFNPSTAQYDSVQLLRGPDALFSGNGEPSGTVNFVRKRPTETWQFKSMLSAGSWNHYAAEADLGGPLSQDGRIRGRLVLAHDRTDQFYASQGTRKSTVYGIVDIDLTRNTLLSLGASRDSVRGASETPVGWARYSNGQPLPVGPRDGFPDWARRDYDNDNLFLNIEHRFSADWKLKGGVSRNTAKGINDWGGPAGQVDPLTGTSTYQGAGPQTWDNGSTVFNLNLVGAFEALGRKHKLALGADFSTARGYGWTSGGPAPGYVGPTIDWNAYDPSVLAYPAAMGGSGDTDERTRRRQSGVYGYTSLQLAEPLRLILGGRFANVHAWSTGMNNTDGSCPGWHATCGQLGPLQTTQRSTGVFTPYYALTYDLSPTWTAYASMSRSFEDQSDYVTADFRALAPATGRSWELGIKGEHAGGLLNSSLSVYRMQRSNYRVYASDSDAFSAVRRNCCYANDGEFVSQGVEIDLGGELTPRWHLSAGYTFDDNQTRYGASNGQRYASTTPKHIFRLWSSYQLPESLSAWKIGGGVQAQSGIFKSGTVRSYNAATGKYDGPSEAYAFTAPGRAIWSAFAEYRINRHLTAQLNVSNLFDKRYFQTVGTTFYGNHYGAPRNTTLTLRGQF